jgi:periplasmic protein CpxP/Spy
MMSNHSLWIVTVLVLSFGEIGANSPIAIADPLTLLSINSLAQAPSPRPGNPPMRDGWLKELNLSRDQIQKIREIRDRYKDRMTQQRQATRQAQKELRDLMAGNASTDQIRQKHDQAQSLQQEFARTRVESMLAIREVLNPEQRQKLAERMKQRGQGMGDRMVEGF